MKTTHKVTWYTPEDKLPESGKLVFALSDKWEGEIDGENKGIFSAICTGPDLESIYPDLWYIVDTDTYYAALKNIIKWCYLDDILPKDFETSGEFVVEKTED